MFVFPGKVQKPVTEKYSESSQISKMELFMKMVNGVQICLSRNTFPARGFVNSKETLQNVLSLGALKWYLKLSISESLQRNQKQLQVR